MARTPDVTAAPSTELPAPRHAAWWAALVYAISTMLLAYPALAGKFLINARSDQYLAGFPFRDFAAQSLKSGHGIPQWSPFIQGGMPYIGAMHGDIFYPTALLRWILPTDVAMTWEFVIHLLLCGLFTYQFLRAWRFGFWSALVGGLAYMLGGSIAGLASPGHDGKLFVCTLLPPVLLLLTRAIRDNRAWAWGALSLVVALTALTPHPQLLQYLLLLSGSFALYLAFSNQPESGLLPRPIALRRLACALGAVGLGLMISALQYMPLFAYKPWSPRAQGHSWAEATSYSYPIEETLNWYWPQFSGILDNYWGQNGIHLHSDYFGVVVLLLAGMAFFGQNGHKSFRRFWLGAGLVSLVWAFGGNTPLFHLIIQIPFTGYLRAPSTMIFVTAFSVAILAAMGMERVIARRVSPKYALAWIGAAAVFGVLMTAGGYTTIAHAIVSTMASTRYAPEVHDQAVQMMMQQTVEPNAGSAILGVWRSFLFVVLAAGLVWAYLQNRIAARNAVIGLAALLVADLWSIERLYWIFWDRASTIYATDPAIEAIKADIAKTGEPGRVFNARIGSGIANELGRADRAFTGDKLWVNGLRIDAGYHGNELQMYKTLLETAIDSTSVRFTPAFWRHENVRYWYTGASDSMMTQIAAQLKLAPFVKLAGPVRNSAGSMVFAYKVPTDNPAAWVATAMVQAPQNQALGTILNPRFDPATVAIVDTSIKDIPGVQLTSLPAPAATKAHVTTFAPGAIDVTLDQPSTAGQALVVSENYYPGWRATVDGKPAPLGLMNYNLIGVALPPGAKSVELRFTDAAYEKGKGVTLIALVVAIGLWVVGAVVDRRRRGPISATA